MTESSVGSQWDLGVRTGVLGGCCQGVLLGERFHSHSVPVFEMKAILLVLSLSPP